MIEVSKAPNVEEFNKQYKEIGVKNKYVKDKKTTTEIVADKEIRIKRDKEYSYNTGIPCQEGDFCVRIDAVQRILRSPIDIVKTYKCNGYVYIKLKNQTNNKNKSQKKSKSKKFSGAGEYVIPAGEKIAVAKVCRKKATTKVKGKKRTKY
jgi:hypothetical protein